MHLSIKELSHKIIEPSVVQAAISAALFILPMVGAAIKGVEIAESEMIILSIPLFLYLCAKPKRVIYAVLALSLVAPALHTNLHFPRYIFNAIDYLVVASLVLAVANIRPHRLISHRILLLFVFVFVTVGSVSAVLNGVAIRLYFEAVLQYVRPFVFLFSSVVILEPEDAYRIGFSLYAILPICTFIVLLQRLSTNLHPDLIGGIFGTMAGSSGCLNVLIIASVIVAVIDYLRIGHRLSLFLFVSLCAVVISVVSELKIVFLEYPAIVLIAMLFLANQRKQRLLLGLCALVIAVGGYAAELVIYPSWRWMSNPSDVYYYMTNEKYSGVSGSVNRLSGFSVISNTLFHDMSDSLIGLGIGAAHNVVGVYSPLYEEFGKMHWDYFASIFVYLETGAFGFVSYLGILFSYLFTSGLSARHLGDEKGRATTLFAASVFTLLSVVLFFYNETFLVQTAGLLWIGALSLPLVIVDCDEGNPGSAPLE